ncbi:MAG: hypothetical protein M3Q44_07485 [bacterium]|nr:hypothetical protein [bacterium]
MEIINRLGRQLGTEDLGRSVQNSLRTVELAIIQKKHEHLRRTTSSEHYPQFPDKFDDEKKFGYLKVFRNYVCELYPDPEDAKFIIDGVVWLEEKCRAYEAKENNGEVRVLDVSGNDVFTHRIEVATLAMQVCEKFNVVLPPNAVVAFVGHDTVEDDDVSLAEIEDRFDRDSMSIIYAMTKVELHDLGGLTKEEAQTRTVQRLINCLRPNAEENLPAQPIAILGKLSDRGVNSVTFSGLKPKYKDDGSIKETAQDRIRRKGEESLAVYYPLADYFRLWDLRDMIGDNSLLCMDRSAYIKAHRVRQDHEYSPEIMNEKLERFIQLMNMTVEGPVPNPLTIGEHFSTYAIADLRVPSLLEIHKRLNDPTFTGDLARPIVYIDAWNTDSIGAMATALSQYDFYTGMKHPTFVNDYSTRSNPVTDEQTVLNVKISDSDRADFVLRNFTHNWWKNMPLPLKVHRYPTFNQREALATTIGVFDRFMQKPMADNVSGSVSLFLREIGNQDLNIVYLNRKTRGAAYEQIFVPAEATGLDILLQQFGEDQLRPLFIATSKNNRTPIKDLAQPITNDALLTVGDNPIERIPQFELHHFEQQKTQRAKLFILDQLRQRMLSEPNLQKDALDYFINLGSKEIAAALSASAEYAPVVGDLSYMLGMYHMDFLFRDDSKLYLIGSSTDHIATQQMVNEVLDFLKQRIILFKSKATVDYRKLTRLASLEMDLESEGSLISFDYKKKTGVDYISGKLTGYVFTSSRSDIDDIRYRLSRILEG